MNKTIFGFIWSAIERFSVQGIQFILGIIIARLVLPSDYGLIAMITIFLSLAQTFIDSGFYNALIQKQNRTELDFSTVFYFNVIIALFFYLILYILSPLIAIFYNEPLLEILIKIVSINLIINSLTIVQRAKLTIELNFRIQAIISLVSVVLSGIIGVFLAYKGIGVWALAIQTLTNNLLIMLLLFLYLKWIPKFCFSISSFKEMFNYGYKLLCAGLLDTLYLNLYTIVIGKFFSSSSLGLYNRASTFAQFPLTNISTIFNRVIFPILCECQNNDKFLYEKYKFYVRILSALVFPLMFFLCIKSDKLIPYLLGDKWNETIPYLRILCVAYILTPIMLLMIQLFNVKGKSGYTLYSEIFKKVVSVIILIISMNFGIKGMCYGLIVYEIIDFMIVYHFFKMIFPCTSILEHVKLFLPAIFVCFFLLIIVYVINVFIPNINQNLIFSICVLLMSYLFLYRLNDIKI